MDGLAVSVTEIEIRGERWLVFGELKRILDRSLIATFLLVRKNRNMRFFLAGIMQGSNRGDTLEQQDYRGQLRKLLKEHFQGCEIYDPLQGNEGSLEYDDEMARATFVGHNHMCREVDVVVAYVPEASMGTAIEMWEAYSHGKAVISISPLVRNWVIRLCSHYVCADLAAFEAALSSQQIQQIISEQLT